MKTRLLAGIAAVALAIGLTACQPPQPYHSESIVKPPATAVHAHGIKEASLLVRYSFGSLYCDYRLTVTDPTNRVVYTAAGGPAEATVMLTPRVTGTFHMWAEGTSPDGRRCVSSVDAISSL